MCLNLLVVPSHPRVAESYFQYGLRKFTRVWNLKPRIHARVISLYAHRTMCGHMAHMCAYAGGTQIDPNGTKPPKSHPAGPNRTASCAYARMVAHALAPSPVYRAISYAPHHVWPYGPYVRVCRRLILGGLINLCWLAEFILASCWIWACCGFTLSSLCSEAGSRLV